MDEIFIYSVCERALKQMIRGGTVVDIGGQIGIVTVFAASRLARVVTCEPVPENYGMILANVKRNHLQESVTVENVAVSRGVGIIEFYTVSNNSGRGTVHPECHGWPQEHPELRRCEVPCVGLDDLFRKHQIRLCDLLKLDCEGSEYDILAAASPETLAAIGTIVLEYHLNVPVESLIDILRQAAFQIDLTRETKTLFAFRPGRAVGKSGNHSVSSF